MRSTRQAPQIFPDEISWNGISWKFHRFTLFALVFLVGVGFVDPVYATMMGDPVPLGKVGFSRLSLEYEKTERKVVSGDSRYTTNLRSDRLLVRGVYGFSDTVELFLWVGGGDAELTSRIFDGDMGLVFGGGGRWKLLEWDDLQLGTGLHVLQLNSNDDTAESSKLSLYEIDADIAAVLTGLSFFKPYGGLRVSYSEGAFSGGPTKHVRSRNWVGLIMGGEFLIWKGFWFGAEARLIDEMSYSIRVSYRP